MTALLAIAAWLTAPGWLGLARWGWVVVASVILVEQALGRSSDPRFRSIADTLRTALGMIFTPILTPVPILGAPALYILRVIKLIPTPPGQPDRALVEVGPKGATPVVEQPGGKDE